MLTEIITCFTGNSPALQGAIFGGIVSLFICWLKLKSQNKAFVAQKAQFEQTFANQKATTYKELITTERIKWLYSLRENIEGFLALGHYLIQKKLSYEENRFCKELLIHDFLYKIEDDFYKFIKYQTAIAMRLNPNDYEEFKNKLTKVSRAVTDELASDKPLDQSTIKNCMETFASDCQKLLKKEWEFIKSEAISFQDKK